MQETLYYGDRERTHYQQLFAVIFYGIQAEHDYYLEFVIVRVSFAEIEMFADYSSQIKIIERLCSYLHES